MKTVTVTTIYSEWIPGGSNDYVSENEPNQGQVELMLHQLRDHLGKEWDIVYKTYEDKYKKVKKYHYELNDAPCVVWIEDRVLHRF